LLLQLTVMLAPIFLALAGALAQGQKDQAIGWLQQTFVRMRGFDTRWSVEQLYQNLLASLDVTQPATLRQLALLLASAGLLVLWDRLRRFGRLWQTLLVATIAVDLLGFGQQFHPTMSYADLAAPSGVATYLAQNP